MSKAPSKKALAEAGRRKVRSFVMHSACCRASALTLPRGSLALGNSSATGRMVLLVALSTAPSYMELGTMLSCCHSWRHFGVQRRKAGPLRRSRPLCRMVQRLKHQALPLCHLALCQPPHSLAPMTLISSQRSRQTSPIRRQTVQQKQQAAVGPAATMQRMLGPQLLRLRRLCRRALQENCLRRPGRPA